MKNFIITLTFSSLFLCLISCEKDKSCEKNELGPDFYDSEYRLGLWITYEKTDTLEFLNDSNLIRRGNVSVNEKYLYQIEEDKLILRLPDYRDTKSQHTISNVEGNSVVLGNMYPTYGFGDNSRTYFKEIAN